MLNIPRSLRPAIVIASFAFCAPALAQNANFAAPGRVEGAGPTLSIGVAVGGTVSEVAAREGTHVRAGQVLVKLDCRPLEVEIRTREAHLAAVQANFDRVRNGPRPDEIAVGEAVVRYSQARAEEAAKTRDRTESLQEGVTVTVARILEVRRDARITAAQLEEARARLSLLRAGSREEDIRQAQALREAAAAELDGARARLEQCTVRAPADGLVVDVLVNPGQFLSSAVPQPLLHIVPDGQLRVRAEVDLQDLAHVCASQTAAVSAEAFPKAAFRAQVASISPEVGPRSVAAAAPDIRDKNVVAVTLNLERGAPALPIGSTVTVRFDACPPKT